MEGRGPRLQPVPGVNSMDAELGVWYVDGQFVSLD